MKMDFLFKSFMTKTKNNKVKKTCTKEFDVSHYYLNFGLDFSIQSKVHHSKDCNLKYVEKNYLERQSRDLKNN